MRKEIYCDNSATTPVYPEVIKEINKYMEKEWGNPSSIYKKGRTAKNAIENARERIAKILNCLPEEIYFTSGGSESNNTIIKGTTKINNNIITSEIEHPATLNSIFSTSRNNRVWYNCINIKKDGTLDLSCFDDKNFIKILEKDITLISLMLVNNETGIIQPVREVSKMAKQINPNIIIHTDAVQAAGKCSLDVKSLGVDAMSLSGHKFGAPKGIGILYLKKGIKCESLINGGGQERTLRSGTENVPYIMGVAKALEISYQDIRRKHKDIIKFDEYFLDEIFKNIPEAHLNTERNSNRAYGIMNLRFDGVDAQNLLLYLDRYGIYVSAGSACHSDSNTPSHVLKAMGLTDEEALSSLRFSFREPLKKSEVKYIIDTLQRGILLQRRIDT